MAIIPSRIDTTNSRWSGRNIWLPGGKPSGVPILNIVGGPLVKLGMSSLVKPNPMSPACIPVLLQANQVRNSRRNNFFMFRPTTRLFRRRTNAKSMPYTDGYRLASLVKLARDYS